MAKDKKLTDFLFEVLYPESNKAEKKFKEIRKDNMAFYKGDQWRRKQASYKAKSTTNYVSLIVRDEVAIITDNSPEVNVIPVDDIADVSTASIMKRLLHRLYYLNNLKEMTYDACLLSAIEQIVYFFPYWDDRACDGQGDVRDCIIRQTDVGRDPSGEDNYFYIEQKVTLAEIARLYPDSVDEVKAQVIKEGKSPYLSESRKPSVPVQSTDGSDTAIYDGTTLTVQEQHAKVDYHRWWIKDESVEKLQDKEDPEKFVFEAKYPNGRWVYTANKKIILKDAPCQVRHFPIVPLVLSPDPENPASGISNIDFVKQQQIDANEMKALIKDWLRAVAFPRGRSNPKAILDPKKIRNYPGTIAPAAPGDFSWDAAPPVPNDLFGFQRMSKDDIEYVSALTDISQGRRPASITSAEGIRLLQESARTVLRPKTARVETAIKKLSQLHIDYIQQGYNVPRVFKIMGEEVSINNPEVKQGTETALNNVMVGEYDVEIEPDSTMPRSDIERFSRLKELSAMGYADRKAILQNSGVRNWMEIEARMAQKEAEYNQKQEQQSQAMAQQEQKGPNASINYKDLPVAGQVQLAAQSNIQLTPQDAGQKILIDATAKQKETPGGR